MTLAQQKSQAMIYGQAYKGTRAFKKRGQITKHSTLFITFAL